MIINKNNLNKIIILGPGYIFTTSYKYVSTKINETLERVNSNKYCESNLIEKLIVKLTSHIKRLGSIIREFILTPANT